MATDTMRGTPASPRQAPGRGTPGTVPGRKPDPRTRQVTAPRHTRPIAEPGAGRRTGAPARPAEARPRSRSPRMPFILLLVGLLGGALVSLLVISTTLAQGAFQITNLQQQNANLAKQEQLLSQQVAQASSPTQIAQEAEQLGMRPNPALQFINLKTGKVVSGKVSSADAAINVPGYTP